MANKISFECNHDKTLEVMLWIINRAGGSVNIYNLLKTVFCADVYHLNRYGRPVTGDAYIAMEYGTVPSFIYSVIKSDPLALAEFDEVIPIEIDCNNLIAKRQCDIDRLSESDIEALECGFEEYGALSFSEVKKKNHMHEAWRKNYDIAPNSTIPFKDLIEDTAILHELSSVNSRSIRI